MGVGEPYREWRDRIIEELRELRDSLEAEDAKWAHSWNYTHSARLGRRDMILRLTRFMQELMELQTDW